MDSTYLILSISIPLVGSFICLLFPKGVRDIWAFLAIGISFVFLLLLISPIAAGKTIAIQLFSQNGGFFNVSFLADGISLIFALVFSFVGMIALIYSLTYMKRYENQREYYFMITPDDCFSHRSCLLSESDSSLYFLGAGRPSHLEIGGIS